MGNYAHAWILVAFFVTTDLKNPVYIVCCCILYIVYKSALFFGTNLLSPKILTFRGLF